MASGKDYAEYVTGLCEGLCVRAMMGEYLLYYFGKLVGGIYDNRLLVKPTAGAKESLPNAEYRFPYDGAKAMLLVEDLEDKALMERLFKSLWEDLPENGKGKKK